MIATRQQAIAFATRVIVLILLVLAFASLIKCLGIFAGVLMIGPLNETDSSGFLLDLVLIGGIAQSVAPVLLAITALLLSRRTADLLANRTLGADTEEAPLVLAALLVLRSIGILLLFRVLYQNFNILLRYAYGLWAKNLLVERPEIKTAVREDPQIAAQLAELGSYSLDPKMLTAEMVTMVVYGLLAWYCLYKGRIIISFLTRAGCNS
ncbi:hypothetical protein STSP2_01540 [Anaerohalosphaera lusitana]|uniref:Uncharacterized protein n=1 Tax=Anaerohalosphaera lusitana TaxID=1936003 RepID=A0A1U9NLD6_9BACT|nr:hypothetical protein [Anaerohalosphaera lusitana]AQT68380.1 hypothetical protein STSP2_01540 [Anaerohalosphaera lusitana]